MGTSVLRVSVAPHSEHLKGELTVAIKKNIGLK